MFTLLFLSQPSDPFLFACERSGSGLGALHLCRSAPFIPCHLFFPFNWFSNFIIQCSWGLSISSLVFFCASTGFVAQTLAVCLIMLETFTHYEYFQTLIIIIIIVIIIIDLLHKHVSPLQEVQAFSCINLFLILLIVILFLILSEIYRKTS